MKLTRRWISMMVIAFSGGIIFVLPFLFEVYYRPMTDAFGLTNTELGRFMSTFGSVSMLAYFPGGWIADRVSPRLLMTVSLLATGAAGLYFSTIPSYAASLVVHGFWGISITLLFWGAMIRATRNWAPPEEQGRAFGILEGIRGIGEMVPHFVLLAIFAWLGSGDKALSVVIAQASAAIMLFGVLCWFFVDDPVAESGEPTNAAKVGLKEVIAVLKMPVIWLIAIVILTGYCAYWGALYFSAYAADVFLTSVAVAGFISIGKMLLKPFAAVAAGFVADKIGVAKSTAILFIVLLLSFVGFALLPGGASMFFLLIVNVLVAGTMIFALRAIYFALLEEGKVPLAVTGTAAGIVSAIGFTPDVFMPEIFGYLHDTYPGAEGYRYFYFVIAGICAVGFIAAMTIQYKYVNKNT